MGGTRYDLTGFVHGTNGDQHPARRACLGSPGKTLGEALPSCNMILFNFGCLAKNARALTTWGQAERAFEDMARQRAFHRTKATLNHNDLQPGGDLEPGYMRRIPRFRDVVDIAVARKHTLDLKRHLREGIDTNAFEEYRMSDSAVSPQSPTLPGHFLTLCLAPQNKEQTGSRILQNAE